MSILLMPALAESATDEYHSSLATVGGAVPRFPSLALGASLWSPLPRRSVRPPR